MNKNIKKRKGFTLVELLVVILIIGILGAIALPKYQLALDKADFKKYQSMAHNLELAYDEYYGSSGEGTKNFGSLIVSLPRDFKQVYDSYSIQCYQNDTMFCCMSDSGASHTAEINCGKLDLSVIYSKDMFSYNYTPTKRIGRCFAKADDKKANRLCAAIGKEIGYTNTWTPKGPSASRSHRVYNLN